MKAQVPQEAAISKVKMPRAEMDYAPALVHFFFEGPGEPVAFNGTIRLPWGETITLG